MVDLTFSSDANHMRIIEQLPPIDEVFKKDVEVIMRGKEERCNIEGRTCLPQKI
jgi:hypothetical protein